VRVMRHNVRAPNFLRHSVEMSHKHFAAHCEMCL